MINMIRKNQKGFTLVEIISTVIILSIILLVAIPAIGGLMGSFRIDYYKKLQKTVKTSGQDYINDNRRLRPSGVFESRVVTTPVLVQNKKLDKLIDYRKKDCAASSYTIVVKTTDKKYQYESCITCPNDNYVTDVKNHPYCNPAWKTNDNISIELSKPATNIYIPLNASLDYIREKLGIRKQIVKKDSKGNIIASLKLSDDKDVIYPTNINKFIGTTAVSGIATYEYGGAVVSTNVHIFQNEAPKVTMTNIKNGTAYSPGTWSTGVRVVLAANDEYFSILGLKISEYQVYDAKTGAWTKLALCPTNTTSCTLNYNTTMNRNYRYRIIVAGGSVSKISADYAFRIDASLPNCNINMINGAGGAYTGAYINTNQISIRYSADDPVFEGLPLSSMSKAELYILNVNPTAPIVTQTLTANVAPWRQIHTITDEGSYNIMLKCYDTVGNFKTTSANINILRDISVKFYSPNSSTLLQTTTYQYSKPMGTLPTPTRTGYTFKGWFTTPTTGGTQVTTTTVLNTTSKTYSLFARWEANIYSVTYNSNGGTTVTNPTSYTYGVGIASFTNPTRTGYRFTGWHDGTAVKSSITATDYGNKALTAQWAANTYTIVYNGAGNTSGTMANTVCTYNTNCTLRANAFVKTGNAFTGWSTTSGGVVAHNNSATVLNLTATHGATINLYAIWSRSSYTVTYNLNGGANAAANPGSYTYGDTVTFANPARTGYRFDGWYKETTFTTKITGITATDTGAVVVYAKWLANTYYIDYLGNGATSGATARTTCTYGMGCALRANGFVRTNYRFNNWTSGGKTYANGATVTSLTATHGGIIQMTANWVQEIKYIYMLHGFGGGTSNVYGFGTQKLNLTANNPYYMETSGYVDATAQANSYSLAVYIYPTAGWTWSARTLITGLAPMKYNGVYFIAPGSQEYGVSGYMYPNSGTREGTVTWNRTNFYQNQTFQQASIWKTVDANTAVTIPAIEAGRAGYRATGWIAENGSVYQPGNVVSMTPEFAGTDLKHSFSAQWTGNTYTVAYNINGGTGGTMATTPCTYGSTCTLRANAFTRTGYRFAGWATSAAGAVAYGNSVTVSNLTTTHGGTVTLYAKWTTNTYTVAFNANGGAGTTASKACEYGSGCVLTANGFSRTGYRWAGWATSAAGAVAYANGATVTNLTATHGATVTLYAKWTANTYTVAFNGNTNTGGTTASKACTYGTACVLTANGFTKTGYSFAGWATSAAGAVTYANGASVTGLTATHGGTVTLYARWTPNTYTVAFNGNTNTGGTTASKACTYGTACVLTANGFTKTGYRFAGWATSAAGAVTYANGASVTGLTATHGGTVTLYARWIPNTYTVAFNGNTNTGGSTASKACTYGVACVLTANGFTKTGYSFAGWATSAAGAVTYANGGSYTNLTATHGATVTLYARWKPQSYTVVYNINGGTSGTMANTTCNYGANCTLRANAFVRTNYIFKGWSSTTTGGIGFSNGGTYVNLAAAGGTKNLYAVWYFDETKSTIYAQKHASCASIIHFYTTQAQNPNRWITTEMTVHYTDGGAIAAAYTGDIAGLELWGSWNAYTFGQAGRPAGTSGYYIQRFSKLYFRVKGKVANTGSLITAQSGFGGCAA